MKGKCLTGELPFPDLGKECQRQILVFRIGTEQGIAWFFTDTGNQRNINLLIYYSSKYSQ